MKAFIHSMTRVTGYAIAVCIVIFPIIVLVTHLLSPLVDQHRGEIEKWASEMTSTQINIGKITLSWEGFQPEVDLNNVIVRKADTKEPVLQIKKVGVLVAVLDSLWQRTFVPGGVMVSGTELTIHQKASGEIAVQGFPSLGALDQQPYQSETGFNDVLKWLSAQPRLILRDIDIRYTGINGIKRFVTLYKLSLKNAGDDHHIHGKAVLHQNIPTDMNVAIDWSGEPDLAKIDAHARLEVSGFSLHQWAQDMPWQGWQVKEGVGNAKVWVDWGQGTFQQVQADMQLYGVKLYSQTDQSVHVINRFSGNIGWKREDGKQIISADDVLLDLPNHLWPANSFYLSLSSDESGALSPTKLSIAYLDFSDVKSFLFASPPLLTAEAKQLLLDTQLKGSLKNTKIVFQKNWQDFSANSIATEFDHISFLSQGEIPGINNISGRLSWDGKVGTVNLDSQHTTFKFKTLFSNPLTLDQLSGDVTLQKEDKAWLITTSALQLDNQDISAKVYGSLQLPTQGSPVANLNSNFSVKTVKHLARYLPVGIMEKNLVEWLRDGFPVGEVQSGVATLKGALNDFPFDHHNGEFLVTASADHVDLHYAPGWPVLKNIKAKLTFSGRQLSVALDGADFLGIPLGKGHAELNDLGTDKPQVVRIKTDEIATDFAHGMRVIEESPLKTILGDMFNGMNVSGPLNLTLSLAVPLENPDKTQVQGDIALQNAVMKFVPWKLTLDKVNGNLRFTENGSEAKNIQATLFNKPLNLQLATIDAGKGQYMTRATFATNLAIADLQDWLKVPLAPIATGSADVKGELDLSLRAPIALRFSSNLKGIAIKAQSPYEKNAAEERAFSAEMSAEAEKPLRLRMRYGDLLGAALLLDKKNNNLNLQAANIRLGKGEATWPPDSGIYITGELDKLDWDQIKTYIDQSGKNNLSGYTFRGLDVTIGELNIFGQHLLNAKVALEASKTAYDVSIESPEIVGEIELPANFTQEGQINAHFQRLHLQADKSLQQSNPLIDVKTLPALNLVANNVSYNDMKLGQVTLKTIPSGHGMIINALRVVSPHLNMQAGGSWSQADKEQNTHLRGVATSTHVSAFLTGLGLEADNLVVKKGQLTFDLNWQDALFNPQLASMSGKIGLNLGPGRIADIGESGNAKMGLGRLLSIFSLQTIPRRLSLDFSDLVQKGYSFDFIRGDFNLRNGNAFTSNMKIDGPVARVLMNGRIGLAQQDFDFTLGVTPYVTSTLPVAATLIGGPIGGLAALAVNTMIGPQISKAIATYNYEVKGPWSNPDFESLKAPQRR